MGTQEPPARHFARLVAVAAQRGISPMHYLDKLHRPSTGAIAWVRIQSAKSAKVGQNSTGVDKLAHIEFVCIDIWR